MCMLRLLCLMAVVPIAALLTASFFVLFTIRKVEEKGLKAFGYAVAGFLWLAALIVFSGAVFCLGKSSFGMTKCNMMQSGMKMGSMAQMRQQENPSGMAMPEKGPLAKNEKCSGMPKSGANKGMVFKAE